MTAAVASSEENGGLLDAESLPSLVRLPLRLVAGAGTNGGSSKTERQDSCPFCAAIIRGVAPSARATPPSAPSESSSDRQSACPSCAAKNAGVTDWMSPLMRSQPRPARSRMPCFYSAREQDVGMSYMRVCYIHMKKKCYVRYRIIILGATLD